MRDKPESPWLPGESCACGGTGWVCYQCHSHQWALQMDPEKHQSRAVPCVKCTETIKCAVTWQPWMLKFRNGNKVKAVPVYRFDAEAEQADRERRERDRAAEMEHYFDEQVSEEIYAEAVA